MENDARAMHSAKRQVNRTSLLAGATILLGAGLRIWQWSAGTSMWYDELRIAQNVRDRGLGDLLFEPLAHSQMAPPGFLASVDISTAALGVNEYALRLVPLLMGILALVLLWRVARRFVTGLPLIGVLLVSAVSPALVWYSGNVKQYAGDLALSSLMVLLALRHIEEATNVRRAVWAAGLGFVAMISSHAAVLTGAVLGLVLFVHWLRHRRPAMTRPLAVLATGWVIGAAAAMWASLRFTSPATREFMRDFHASGFAPWQDGILAVVLWIPERLFNTIAHYMVFLEGEAWPLAVPMAILAVAGVVILWSRHGVKGLLLIAPLLAALLGGLTMTLPMRHRVAVYAGAPILVLGMLGLQALLERRSRWVKAVGMFLAFIALVPLTAVALGTARPPYRNQETRPVLTQIAERRSPGDVLYVYCHANAAADFYGPAVGVTEYVAGGCQDSEDEFIDELRTLPDGRVWFFFTFWMPERPWPDAAQAFLAGRGREVERITDPYGLSGAGESAAILYELGSPEATGSM